MEMDPYKDPVLRMMLSYPTVFYNEALLYFVAILSNKKTLRNLIH